MAKNSVAKVVATKAIANGKDVAPVPSKSRSSRPANSLDGAADGNSEAPVRPAPKVSSASAYLSKGAKNARLREMEKKYGPERVSIIRSALAYQAKNIRKGQAEDEEVRAAIARKEARRAARAATAEESVDAVRPSKPQTAAEAAPLRRSTRKRKASDMEAPAEASGSKPKPKRVRKSKLPRELEEQKPVTVFLQRTNPELPTWLTPRPWYPANYAIWVPRPGDTYLRRRPVLVNQSLK
ncbi:hypothetical protein TWF730_001502 [Orbilia blumenaviensis]|uniref:Uncharacterized protein n=1 Tax=Orbilia blumenaviensis TaxID=1796055 RepID=A0AAV9UHV2_9PEZI